MLLSFLHHTVSIDGLLEGYNDVTWLSSALQTGKNINRQSLKYELYKEKMLQQFALCPFYVPFIEKASGGTKNLLNS